MRKLFAGILVSSLATTTLVALSTPASADSPGCPAPSAPTSGNGTSSDPFQIATEPNLVWMRDRVNGGTNDEYYLQTADLDFEGCTWSTAIGGVVSTTTRFEGFYDGDGHIVEGLNISAPDRAGLFGAVDLDSTVSGTTNGISIRDVGFTGDVSMGAGTASTKTAGGLVGYLYKGSISGSFSSGRVSSAEAGARVGGLVGYVASSSSVISNSYATGPVETTGSTIFSTSTGGLVGDFFAATTITDSYATGAVDSVSTREGGLVGYQSVSGTITNSFWDTDTTGQATSDGGTGKTTSEMTTLTTFSTTTPAWDIAEGYDASYTWGICSAVNDGYPFLTAFYSTDPCVNPPAPSAGDYSRPTATFHFRLDNGQECAPISPQLVYTNTRYILPGANAPCRTPGSELIGWSVPHQDWYFAPGATVFVVESQVFTAVLRQPTISVTWDANVSQSDTCLVDSNGSESNATSFQRTSVTYVDRPGMSDYPSGDRPSLADFSAPNAAPCSPPGLALTNWELASSSGDIVVTPGESIDDAIAQASPNGGINDFTFRAQWGLPQQPREISRAGFFVGTSDELTDSGRQRLRELQQAVPVGASDVVVEIIGMSESLANSAENRQLALKRADVVKRTLESSGLLGTYLSSTDPSVIAPTRSGSGKALTTVRITYLAPAPAV